MNINDNEGQTALINAAHNGHTETAEALIRHGADVNMKANKGQTALVFAARNGHTKTALLIFQYGIDVNICALLFGTALDAWAAHRQMHRRKVRLVRHSYLTSPPLCLFIFGYDFQPLPLGAVIDLITTPTNFAATLSMGVPASEADENSMLLILLHVAVLMSILARLTQLMLLLVVLSSVEITSLTRSGFTGLSLRRMEE